MEKRRSKVFGLLVVVATFAFGTVAFAGSSATPKPVSPEHPTGHESRTPAQCEHLEGTQTDGERGWCMKCVAIGKTHYHPDCPVKHRCNLDNGKQDCNEQPPGWAGN
jgi:hypothetical protein